MFRVFFSHFSHVFCFYWYSTADGRKSQTTTWDVNHKTFVNHVGYLKPYINWSSPDFFFRTINGMYTYHKKHPSCWYFRNQLQDTPSSWKLGKYTQILNQYTPEILQIAQKIGNPKRKLIFQTPFLQGRC